MKSLLPHFFFFFQLLVLLSCFFPLFFFNFWSSSLLFFFTFFFSSIGPPLLFFPLFLPFYQVGPDGPRTPRVFTCEERMPIKCARVAREYSRVWTLLGAANDRDLRGARVASQVGRGV